MKPERSQLWYHISSLCTSAINLQENSWNGGITAIGNENKQSRGIAPHVTAYFFLSNVIGIDTTNEHVQKAALKPI